jgi:transcriptional regulator with XRE-family HTH domain
MNNTNNLNINVLFGANLRKFREAKKLSQMDFALSIGIDATYYGRIERGEHSTTLDTCVKISQYLGVPLASLFENLPI